MLFCQEPSSVSPSYTESILSNSELRNQERLASYTNKQAVVRIGGTGSYGGSEVCGWQLVVGGSSLVAFALLATLVDKMVGTRAYLSSQ